MALSGTNRGTGGNNTAATTVNISPASNFTANSAGVLAIAYDNAGGGGSDNFSSISFPTGAWTLVPFGAILNDPGAANAGSVLRIYYNTSLSSFNTTDTITITFAANVTAKAWTLTEITTNTSGASISTDGIISFNTGSGTTQQASTNYLSGEFAFGALGQEGNGTRTGDSDTTNGSWSTAQGTGFGTTTGGQEIITQFKVVTADGTQTYNPTASPIGDWNCMVMTFREVAPAANFDPFGMMGFFGI